MANKPAKPGETRGNRNGQPREPIGADGKRHPTEKQLECRRNLREIAKYEYDDNVADIIATMCQVATLESVDTNNAEEVERNFVEYINICAEKNYKPTAEGLALSIGVARMTLYNWVQGINKKPPEVVEVCKKYMALLNSLHIQYTLEGKINPIPAIFIAKNNFENYHDTQEFKFSANNNEDASSTEALADKYKETMAIDITDDVTNVD